MARPDATAQAALSQRVTRPVWFATLDFANGPLRATTLPYNIAPISADPELNGQTFYSLTADVQDMGQVHNQEGGSETVVMAVSGALLPDAAILATIGNKANWQGRAAKIWQGMKNEDGTFAGVIWEHHQGWMSSVKMGGNGRTQMIQIEIEGYLAMLNRPSQRTYMEHGLIDAADTSSGVVGAIRAPGTGGQTVTQPASGGYGGGSGAAVVSRDGSGNMSPVVRER